MEDWKGFVSKARKLLKSNEFAEARKQVSAGLQLFPNEVALIVVAIDSCCALGEYEQALDYAHHLIRCHPQIWRVWKCSSALSGVDAFWRSPEPNH